MSFSWSAAVAVFGILTAAPSLALAGDPSLAEKLFEDGMTALKKEDFKAACDAFAGSDEADPSPGTEINLALCNEKLGKTATAWGWYRTAAGLAEQRGQRDRAERARSDAARLEPLLPKIRIVTKDPAATLSITRDGNPVPSATIGKEIPVDSGTYQFEVSAKGKKSWSTSVDVPAGAHVTVVEVPLLEDMPQPQGPSGHPAGGDEASSAAKTRRTVGYVAGGAGIVAGAVAITFVVVARSEINKRNGVQAEIDKTPSGDPNLNNLNQSRQSHADAANSNKTIALVTGIGAVALVGAGVALVATSFGSSDKSPKAGALEGPRFLPLLGNGTAGLGFLTTF